MAEELTQISFNERVRPQIWADILSKEKEFYYGADIFNSKINHITNRGFYSWIKDINEDADFLRRLIRDVEVNNEQFQLYRADRTYVEQYDKSLEKMKRTQLELMENYSKFSLFVIRFALSCLDEPLKWDSMESNGRNTFDKTFTWLGKVFFMPISLFIENKYEIFNRNKFIIFEKDK